MTTARRTLKDYRYAAAVALMGMAIIFNYSLLVPALGNLSDQAHAGDKARSIQIKRGPSMCKEQIAFYLVGVISHTQLETFAEDAVPHCRIPGGPEHRPYLLPRP